MGDVPFIMHCFATNVAFWGRQLLFVGCSILLWGCSDKYTKNQSVQLLDNASDQGWTSALEALQAPVDYDSLDAILIELGAQLSETQDFLPAELGDITDPTKIRHHPHYGKPRKPSRELLGDEQLLALFERDHPLVDKWMEYFMTRGRDQFERFYGRYLQHGEQLRAWLREEGVPDELIWLAFIESGINPKAYSRAHAAGIWQFIVSTGRLYGLRYDFWTDERRDPEKATRAAARHLKDLYNEFGQWELAFSAYNAGARRVSKAIRYIGSADFWLMVNNKYALPKETRHYTPKMIAARRLAQDPKAYGFAISEVTPAPVLASVEVPGGLPIWAMAEQAGLDLQEFKQLNLHIRRNITDPNKKTLIYVPVAAKNTFELWLAAGNLPIEEFSGDVYIVQKGDTLSTIAREFATTVHEIKALNNLRSTQIYPRQQLIVPGPAVKSTTQPAQTKSVASAVANQDQLVALQQAGQVIEADAKYIIYRVRKGDTLYDIANRFQTSVAAIKKANGKSSNQIKIGETIKIPKPPQS